MKLISDRLECWPLTEKELVMYIRSRSEFESVMGLMQSGIGLSENTSEELSALGYKIKHDTEASQRYFSTLWLIVERSTQCIVGQYCFNGFSDDQGAVEITFEIEDTHRGKGLAREAVDSILTWLKKQSNVNILWVEVAKDNIPVAKALSKLGFSRDPECSEESTTVCYFYYFK